MTNEDAILDILVPCNSEGEKLAYPKCVDNLSCFPSLVTSAAGPKLSVYLLIFLDGTWTSLTD